MSFGDVDETSDEAGNLATIPYNGKPAVKLFVDAGDAVSRQAALYWQGLADVASIERFLTVLSVTDLYDASVDAEFEVDIRQLLAESPRIYLQGSTSLGGGAAEDVAIWASLEKHEGGLSPEVGVAMSASLFALEKIEHACKQLIGHTILWKDVSKVELDDLMAQIRAMIDRHTVDDGYMLRAR